MPGKLWIAGREFSRDMKRQNISTYAASTAFFFFLSLVPMLIMICTVIPFTPLTEENLLKAVTDFTPDMVDPLAESLIYEVYDKSAGILSLAVLTTLWSAGKGVLALMRGLNAINHVQEERNYLVVRLIATFYTFVMLLVMILSLFLMVFGNELVEFLLHNIPQVKAVIDFCMNFRFLAVWVVLMLLFAAVYAYVPNKKSDFKGQLPGASFAAVVWGVFSWGFSLYVGRSGSYSIYGSLTIVVIVMVWMYFCMYIILVGAYLNRYFLTENEKRQREKE